MHEMTIATELLAATLSAVADHADELSSAADSPCIESVEVEIGLLQQIVPEALELAWQAVCDGTAAQGAALTVTETPAAACCKWCGESFSPAVDDYLCPGCGKADVDIRAGNDILLRSITCQADEG